MIKENNDVDQNLETILFQTNVSFDCLYEIN